MANINLGRVSPVPQGAWDSTTTYEKLDIVSHNGSSYMARQDVPVGAEITNNEYWEVLSVRATPSFSIGQVNTVSASTGAGVSLSGTDENPVLNFDIPRGVAGNESIDDSAGEGDTDKVLSADRVTKLFNANGLTDDPESYFVNARYIAKTDHKATANAQYLCTGFIPVTPGMKFEYCLGASTVSIIIASYSAADRTTVIDQIDGSGEANILSGIYIVPVNARYIRFCKCINTTAKSNINANMFVHFLNDYHENILEYDIVDDISDLNFVSGYFIDKTTGQYNTHSSATLYATKDFYKVSKDIVIEYNIKGSTAGAIIAFYDKFFNYMENESVFGKGERLSFESKIVPPHEAKYARFFAILEEDTYIKFTPIIYVYNRIEAYRYLKNKNYIFEDSIFKSGVLLKTSGNIADDGYKATGRIPVVPNEKIYYKLAGYDNYACIVVFDIYGKFLRSILDGVGAYNLQEGVYIVEKDVAYIAFAYSSEAKPIEQYIYFFEKPDIVSRNEDAINAIRSSKEYKFSNNDNTSVKPLSLLHFTDIHGMQKSLENIVYFYNANANIIDDIVDTGDNVTVNWGSGYSFWDAVPGSEKILVTEGNHDTYDENEDLLSIQERYENLIEPYKDNWNATTVEGKMWWYKDYITQKIRLVGLSSSYLLSSNDLSAERTWFQSVLADAIANDLAVIVAQHYLPETITTIPSNFTQLYNINQTQTLFINEGFLQDINSFIQNGGEFICHLCGHQHRDVLAYHQSYPNQIFVCPTTAANDYVQQIFSDLNRQHNTKMEDAFNVITVDRNLTQLRIVRIGADIDMNLRSRKGITINYSNKNILGYI